MVFCITPKIYGDDEDIDDGCADAVKKKPHPALLAAAKN